VKYRDAFLLQLFLQLYAILLQLCASPRQPFLQLYVILLQLYAILLQLYASLQQLFPYALIF
jgi:hypothetical protein